MKRSMTLIALFGLLGITAPAAAGDLSGLYPIGTLTREKPRLEGRIKELLARGFWPSLTPEERARLHRVELTFPLVGGDGGPLEFSAGYDPRTNTYPVTLPILSLLSLEDLCTAYAWLQVKNYPLETMDDYVALLKHRKPEDFPAKRYPPPLEALRVPPGDLKDPRVDELSLRLRNTAYAFILGHELGHVYYRHKGYGPDVPREQARANEEAADGFALELLRRTATIPMGAMLYFQTAVHIEPNRWDFRSEREWEAWQAKTATHPLTSRRLRLLAEELNRRAADFARGQPNRQAATETVRYIAARIAKISGILEDQDLHLAAAKRARELSPAALAPSR
jgi:hypothetical protein